MSGKLFTKTTTRIEYDFIEGVSNEINGFWGQFWALETSRLNT